MNFQRLGAVVHPDIPFCMIFLMRDARGQPFFPTMLDRSQQNRGGSSKIVLYFCFPLST